MKDHLMSKKPIPLILELKFISRFCQFKRNLINLFHDLFTTDRYMDIDIELGKFLEKNNFLTIKSCHYNITKKFKQAIKSYCKETK